MYKWISMVMLTVLFSTVSLFADDDAVAYFKELRENIYTRLPDSFSGELTGKMIEEKLDSIPDDYILSKSGAYVELSFSKTSGVDIIVKDVDFLYEDLFEQYVRFFTLGPVLSTQSSDTILKKYEFSFSTGSDDTIVLNLRFKNADNNFDIYVSAETYEIQKVDYYLDEDILSSVIIVYDEVDDYTIPQTFLVKTFESGESLPEVFEIENISVD